MAFTENYRRQVALLIRALPLIAEEDAFALKGGTAINLFVRNLPRLSVDIDLTYLPVQGRAESLAAIGAALKRIAGRISKAIPGAQSTEGTHEGSVTKLFVRSEGVQILIEVTPVLRGCVYQPETGIDDALRRAFIVYLLSELEAAREALIAEIVGKMPADHRRFLVSFERGEPEWKLLGVPGAHELPAVRWRQHNLDKISKEKRAGIVARLEEVLDRNG